MVIKPHLSITPLQVHAGFWWDSSYEQMVSINILNGHPSKGTCIIIYVRQPAAGVHFSIFIYDSTTQSSCMFESDTFNLYMEKSCHLPSVVSHHTYILAKWYLNYTTKREKKTHHILHFIAMNLICLSFFGQMLLITMCVLNILNVLKRPYANPVNAVCMRTFVIIFKLHSFALHIVSL